MKTDPTRLLAAINRNFAETNNALLKITAHDTLSRTEITYARMSFFLVAMDALVNDAIAHAIRVLDEHRDAASFWYVVKCDEALLIKSAARAGLDLSHLQETSRKLRKVREKTHFHIDREAVIDPSQVWRDAEINGAALITTLRDIAHTLAYAKFDLIGGPLETVTEYDGSDIPRIILAYEHAYGSVHGA
jgi:hypothetical protein